MNSISSVSFEDPLSVPNHPIRRIAWIAAIFGNNSARI